MTKRASVIGSPIVHSQSPPLHTAAYRHLGLDIDYTRTEVTEDTAEAFFADLKDLRSAGTDVVGLSVTMPMKHRALDFVDAVDNRVDKLGALNTIVFDADHRATGYNTDVDGIANALRFAGFRPAEPNAQRPLAILGTGGTATAAVAAASVLGVSGIEIFGRNPAALDELYNLARAFGLDVTTSPLQDIPQGVQRASAVVSTLPAGVVDEYLAPLKNPEILAPDTQLPPLLDAIYDPWPTFAATVWQNANAQVVSGLEMLMYQAVEQVKLFTHRLLPAPQTLDWGEVTNVMAHAIGLPARSA